MNDSTDNDESTLINLPEDDFEKALKALKEPQYPSGSMTQQPSFGASQLTTPQRLAFELKKKDAERQKEDENSNYSAIRFDPKKLKKSSSHDSYKFMIPTKSSSNMTSINVDANLNLPLKKSSLSESSWSRNEIENSSSRCFTTVIDETLPICKDANNTMLKLRRSNKDPDEKTVTGVFGGGISNYGSINTDFKFSGSNSNRGGDLQDSEDMEMVEMEDLRNKAVYGRSGTVVPPISNDDSDEPADRISGKRRSASQRSGHNQGYDLIDAFHQDGHQYTMLKSEFDQGLITQRYPNFSTTRNDRFSSPQPNNRRRKANRRNKRSEDDVNTMKSEQINGFRGYQSVESLIYYIEGADPAKKSIPVDDSNKKGRQRKEVKKEKAKKASSIGAASHDDDDDLLDVTSMSMSSSMPPMEKCKSEENLLPKTKLKNTVLDNAEDEFYVVAAGSKVTTVADDDVDYSSAFFDDDVIVTDQGLVVTGRQAVEEQQFIPVTFKKKKSKVVQRSRTPPHRAVNEKCATGARRKRRSSFDSSPVHHANYADHSTSAACRDKVTDGQRNVKCTGTNPLNESSIDTSAQPSTSTVPYHSPPSSAQGDNKLSYAVVVQQHQRRPHSPACSERSATVTSSCTVTMATTPRRQTASLNASRSNSPTCAIRASSASATNQANASSPDLKLFTDLPPLPSNPNNVVTVVTTCAVSPASSCRTSYATVVTTKMSPGGAAKHLPSRNSSSTVAAPFTAAECNKLSNTCESLIDKQRPSTSIIILRDEPSHLAEDVEKLSTTNDAGGAGVGRRFSCPPIRGAGHVEFLDSAPDADSAGPYVVGFTFGFGDPPDGAAALEDDAFTTCDNDAPVAVTNANALTSDNDLIDNTTKSVNVDATDDNCASDNKSTLSTVDKKAKESFHPVYHQQQVQNSPIESVAVVENPTASVSSTVRTSKASSANLKNKSNLSSNDLVLNEIVNFVNKRWNDFVKTPDIVWYQK